MYIIYKLGQYFYFYNDSYYVLLLQKKKKKSWSNAVCVWVKQFEGIFSRNVTAPSSSRHSSVYVLRGF